MKLEYIKKCNLCKSTDITPINKSKTLFKCNKCMYVFDSPRPTFSEIAKFYSKSDKYDSWLKHYEKKQLVAKRRLKIIQKFKISGTLLDVGAGIGIFLKEAQDNGFKIQGTEISKSGIKVAKEKNDIKIKQSELETVPFKKHSFDVITLFHVLEHVPDPAKTMKTCKSLLKKDGILVIAVPNEMHSKIRQPLKRLLSILKIGKFKWFGKYGLPRLDNFSMLEEIHLSHFTEYSLKKFLTKNHFSIIYNSLDPYFIATGIFKIIHFILYYLFLGIKKITNRNFYDTMLIIAKNSNNKK